MDDTIENLLPVWVSHINKMYGTKVDYTDINEWDIHKYFPTLTKHQVFLPLTSIDLWKDVTPLPGACEYLEKLVKDGHEVYIVTASSPETISLKLNLVLFEYFPFIDKDKVIITSHKQMIQGDVMVDDAPHNLVGGNYLKVLKDNFQNRNYPEDSHHMVRAYSWEDIYNIITNYAIIKEWNE